MTNHPPASGRHWFEQWFDDNYLKLYRHRDSADARRQVDLIVRTLRPNPADPILDLACGEGRHVALLKERGFRVSGIDLSPVLVERGLERDPTLDIRVGDMRHIDGRYAIILSLFTSFGYFDEDEQNRHVLAGIANALQPGGWFWLDFLNPAYVRKTLVPETTRTLEDGAEVVERRSIQGPMVVKDIRFETAKGTRTYQERVRLYQRDELVAMMEETGIRVVGGFGDYDGRAWWLDSPRTILYGRKT